MSVASALAREGVFYRCTRQFFEISRLRVEVEGLLHIYHPLNFKVSFLQPRAYRVQA